MVEKPVNLQEHLEVSFQRADSISRVIDEDLTHDVQSRIIANIVPIEGMVSKDSLVQVIVQGVLVVDVNIKS